MITVKIYKYDSGAEGYRGEDYSAFVLQGFSNTEKLNQELDVSEITLYGVDFGEEFTPGTKFIVDVYDGDNLAQTLHRVCQNDAVDKPILSKEGFYRHAISLIEPSVIAQERICDNISITYKLKDVSLETRTTYDQDAKMEDSWKESSFIPAENFGYRRKSQIQLTYDCDCHFGKYFTMSPLNIGAPLFFVRPDSDSAATSNKRFNNISAYEVPGEAGTYKARFYFPNINIWLGVPNTKEYYKAGEVSFDYEILAYDEKGELSPADCVNGFFTRSTDLDAHQYNSFPYSNDVVGDYTVAGSTDLKQHWVIEKIEPSADDYNTRGAVHYKVKKYTTAYNSETEKTYVVAEIKPNYNYKVTVSIHNFEDDVPVADRLIFSKYTGDAKLGVCGYNVKLESAGGGLGSAYFGRVTYANYLATESATDTTETLFYSVDALNYILQSANPYTAYNLLVKAILNSGEYEKQSGVSSVAINNPDYECPFYIDPSYEATLQNTVVNETFFQQKNLWEIALVVGNYIHAIPEIVFGNGDKYMFTFTQLGQTEQSEDGGQKINILNTRAIDDYISSVSSYVDNIVQLGGEIQEKVVPKTRSENMLVYNDTAVIEVSKSIIELLEVKVIASKAYTFDGVSSVASFSISAGDEADMTRYIYEKNVYGVLPIEYNEVPNKGYALYYDLGTNVIQGGQYQLPRPSTDLYSDYAFKKVIYCAFHKEETGADYPDFGAYTGAGSPWHSINVSDFYFVVRYRTKDSARVDHTRPDLRKYLIASTREKIPVHAQFNNQEDVLVDSEAFGANVFGKLARTGNTNYHINEWHKNTDSLKKKGDLIRINGDLYYVAKVNNTYYHDHIVSEVEYSKDFNQLSQVVSIPSEPRFYEISEQNQIRREKVISDYMMVTTDTDKLQYADGYIRNFDALLGLCFVAGSTFYKYAISVFKGDQNIGLDVSTFGVASAYKIVMSPINAFSSGNTLTYEWDMKDNFSAGDKVEEEPDFIQGETADGRYRPLRAVQYTDVYGKATLFDFYILPDLSLGADEIRELPDAPTDKAELYNDFGNAAFTNVKQSSETGNENGIVLLKDSRESMSFNYNIHLLTGSDTFVTSPYFFRQNKTECKLVLLANEINKLSNGRIDDASIITAKRANNTSMAKFIEVDFDSYRAVEAGPSQYFYAKVSEALEDVNEGHFEDGDYDRVKAIAIVFDIGVSGHNYPLVIGRNIPNNFTKAQAIKNWYFGTPKKDDVFSNKQ